MTSSAALTRSPTRSTADGDRLGHGHLRRRTRRTRTTTRPSSLRTPARTRSTSAPNDNDFDTLNTGGTKDLVTDEDQRRPRRRRDHQRRRRRQLHAERQLLRRRRVHLRGRRRRLANVPCPSPASRTARSQSTTRRPLPRTRARPRSTCSPTTPMSTAARRCRREDQWRARCRRDQVRWCRRQLHARRRLLRRRFVHLLAQRRFDRHCRGGRDLRRRPDPRPVRTLRLRTSRLTLGPSGKTKDTTPTFAFSSSDATARFTCSVDGGRPPRAPRPSRRTS